jgi:hypothetical protein
MFNDREEQEKVVKYFENYEIQLIENKVDLDNMIIV